MMHKKTLLSISIAFAVSHTAIAQENAPKESKSPTSIDTMVVTATRTNNTLTNTAATVEVIDSEEIEKNIAQNLQDVLEYTPGVTVNSTARQGIQTINIRGIEGNRVKILVDGATQGQAFDGGNTAFINSSAITIDPDMLKTVEIIKGAASSIHGSNALGGVVTFETKDPADFLKEGENFGGHAKLTYSSKTKSFSENAVFASRTGNLESMLAYTRRDGQELQNFRDSNEYSNYAVTDQDTANNDVLVKMQYQANEAHRIEFLGELTHNEADSDIYHSSYSNYTGEDTTKQYRIGFKHIWYANFTFADTITSNLTWQSKKDNGLTQRHSAATSGNAWVAASGENDQTKDYDYEDTSIEFETQFDKQTTLFGLDHSVIYGLNYNYSDLTNINRTYNSDVDTDDEITVYTPNATEQKFGLFVQDEIALLNGDLLVTPGVRFDAFSTNPGTTSITTYERFDDAAVTGRLGTVYHFTPKHSVYAQISQGYRAPTFSELYYSYTNTSVGYESIPNPDLEAETSISYELGYRYSTNFAYFSVSAFYSDYDNFIDQIQTGTVDDVDQYSYVNVDKATIKGVELSNQLQLDKLISAPEGLSSRIAATYIDGENGDGESLESVNPWNAVVGMDYDQQDGLWGTSVKLNYTAKRKTSNLTVPSAGVVDITAYYKPITDLTLSAGIFNLTDKEYYYWNDVRSDSSLKPEKSQAKRNYSVSVKYEF